MSGLPLGIRGDAPRRLAASILLVWSMGLAVQLNTRIYLHFLDLYNERRDLGELLKCIGIAHGNSMIIVMVFFAIYISLGLDMELRRVWRGLVKVYVPFGLLSATGLAIYFSYITRYEFEREQAIQFGSLGAFLMSISGPLLLIAIGFLVPMLLTDASLRDYWSFMLPRMLPRMIVIMVLTRILEAAAAFILNRLGLGGPLVDIPEYFTPKVRNMALIMLGDRAQYISFVAIAPLAYYMYLGVYRDVIEEWEAAK